MTMDAKEEGFLARARLLPTPFFFFLVLFLCQMGMGEYLAGWADIRRAE